MYTESFVGHPGWVQVRPAPSTREGAGRCPGRVPFVMHPIRRRRVGGSWLWVRVWLLEHRTDTLDQLGRDVVAATLGSKHLLQLPLEVRVPRTGVARSEMSLDLDVLEPNELTVEVQLDLSKDVFAVSR